MPLRYVDPNEKRGMWYRAMVRFGRFRLSRFIARRITSRIDSWS
jgi:hypothetical protein